MATAAIEKSVGWTSIKLSYDLRQSLGFSLEENISAKFIRRDVLTQILAGLALNIPQLADCKSEIVFIKTETQERTDVLKIIVSEELIEAEMQAKLSKCDDQSVNITEAVELETEANEPGAGETENCDESAASEPAGEARFWTPLGSEQEIILSHAPKQRPLQVIEAEINVKGEKKKSLANNSRGDRNDACFLPIKDQVDFSEKRTMDSWIQVGESQDAEAQTVINFPANTWTQWTPQSRDFESEYSEEQKEHLNKWVQTKANDVIDFVYHNTILDLYTDDFQNLVNAGDQLGLDCEKLQTGAKYFLLDAISSFEHCPGVAIAHAWHPKLKNFLVISYGGAHKNAAGDEVRVCDELSHYEEKCSKLFCENVILWDTGAGAPLLHLLSSFQVECVSFCPSDERILIGGCDNGDVKMWKLIIPEDSTLKVKVDPTFSVKSVSRTPVIGLHWLSAPANQGASFLTVSADGSMSIWCLEGDEIKQTSAKFTVCSKKLFYATATCLPRDSKTNSARTGKRRESAIEHPVFDLLIGSHDGTVSLFKIDTRPTGAVDDDDSSEASVDLSSSEIKLSASCAPKLHDGPVCSINESPLEEEIFISVGGRTFSIFSTRDIIVDRPLVLKRGSCCLSSGCWSLYSKNIFYVFTNTGALQVWNLTNQKSCLEAQLNISPGFIKDLSRPDCCFRDGTLPMTDDRGTIMICQIPENHQLSEPGMEKIFGREVRRASAAVRLQPSEAVSHGLKTEAKLRARAERREDELLKTRTERLVKAERPEVAGLRELALRRDRATKREADRRLRLIEALPQELLALKRVDRQRLLEIERPMRDVQRRQLRQGVLTERRLHANPDFLK